jgi:hypothetical protein
MKLLRQLDFAPRPLKWRRAALLCMLAVATVARGQDNGVPEPDRFQESQQPAAQKAEEPRKAQDSQPTFDSFTIGSTTLSNVTIVARTATHISFQHKHGFASVKMIDLSPESQAKLGFTPPPPRKSVLDYTKEWTRDGTHVAQTWLADPRLVHTVDQEVRPEIQRIMVGQDELLLYSILGGVGCIYVLFCLGTINMCKKTTVHPGVWAWLPGCQFVSLFKAAGMSPWNYLWLYIPPINLIVMIVWCFKICRARQKHPALGFLMLLVPVNIFVFFYLAFSSGKEAPVPSGWSMESAYRVGMA